MTKIFSPIYIFGNEFIFWLFVITMIVIMIATLIFVIKELNNK